MKEYMVYAYPSSRSSWNGRQEAGPFEKPEAVRVAREQRARRVYGRVEVKKVSS